MMQYGKLHAITGVQKQVLGRLIRPSPSFCTLYCCILLPPSAKVRNSHEMSKKLNTLDSSEIPVYFVCFSVSIAMH